jgi:hypothetical protein
MTGRPMEKPDRWPPIVRPQAFGFRCLHGRQLAGTVGGQPQVAGDGALCMAPKLAPPPAPITGRTWVWMDSSQFIHHFTTHYPNQRHTHRDELGRDFLRLLRLTEWKDPHGDDGGWRLAVLVKNEHLHATPQLEV